MLKALRIAGHRDGQGAALDKTDVILCQLLLANSRTSYRELGEKLNLSVTAVHNRIQTLIELGVIRKLTAKLSLVAKNGIHILIFGASKLSTFHELNPKLQSNDSIYWLAIGGGNILYIGAWLKNIAELDKLVRFVKEAALMPEPTVSLTVSPIPPYMKFPVNPETSLCSLDYKIVRSLKDDSRKPTSEVAEELGVSTKTVRRRLNRMIENYLISLSMDWYPDASNDIISVFHVQLRPEADQNGINAIWMKHYPNLLFYWGFSNIPNSYLFMAWTTTAKQLRDLRENLENEPAIQSLTANILYTGYIFPSWMDEIP